MDLIALAPVLAALGGVEAVAETSPRPRRGAVVAVTGDWWLEDWEKAILDFNAEHALEGYRWLAFIRLDTDLVAVSSASVYRVLSHIDIPRMDGIQLVVHIKQDARLKAISVVIVSCKDREEDQIRSLDAGANSYLGLLAVLRACLGSSSTVCCSIPAAA